MNDGLRCLTLDDIQLKMLSEETLCEDDVIWPTSPCLPMGFAWSSYVAQSEMVGACEDAGATPSQFITDELTLQDLCLPSFSVATDDVLHSQAASLEEHALLELPFRRLDGFWQQRGIISNQTKTFDLCSNGDA